MIQLADDCEHMNTRTYLRKDKTKLQHVLLDQGVMNQLIELRYRLRRRLRRM